MLIFSVTWYIWGPCDPHPITPLLPMSMVRVQKRNAFGQIMPYRHRAMLRTMARTAARYWLRRRVSTAVKNEPTRNEPLTGQFDYKTDYRKRRVNKRLRTVFRKRRRFTRRIMSVVNNYNNGTVHLVRRTVGSLTTTVDLSDAVSYGLFGLDGNTSGTFNTCDDIKEFLKEKDATSWNNWNTPALAVIPYRLYVKHAIMEHTMRNTGANDAIIEVYYIVGRKVLPAQFGSPSPIDVYSAGFNKQPLAQDPDTGALYDGQLAYNLVGTTPFQCSWFCQNYRIYKRQKFRLPPGNEISIVIHGRSKWFQVSDTKNRVTDRRYHGVLIQQQGSPLGTGTGSLSQPITVAHLNVRRYTCRFVPNKVPSDALEVTDA